MTLVEKIKQSKSMIDIKFQNFLENEDENDAPFYEEDEDDSLEEKIRLLENSYQIYHQSIEYGLDILKELEKLEKQIKEQNLNQIYQARFICERAIELTSNSEQFQWTRRLNDLNRKQYDCENPMLLKIDKTMEQMMFRQEINDKYTNRNLLSKVEEFTKMKISKIIFNSDTDNWRKDKSVFGDRLLGKKNIAIVIETTKGERVCQYISVTIDKIAQLIGGQWIDKIEDTKSFLIVERENGTDFDRINMKNGKTVALTIFPESQDYLMTVGFTDMKIKKQTTEEYSESTNNEKNSFNLTLRYTSFGIKYIHVYQLI